jgi:hypothetical protein
LNKADKVEVLDRSSVKMKIGSLNDYWYKIRIFSDGLEGWCFGGYLEIEGN